jgi:hypothetical protein
VPGLHSHVTWMADTRGSRGRWVWKWGN